ncbi:uncharacterized protein VP01_3807g2 [Puccinia sorghi]|uniref:Uncharacterized protein n=1 Tax=Puccinia sorghi TaxID=27349 RepID=A0A0L6UTC4_9BASI|nr:uncharacterized protein VP01_3807g2 [Puccinia sorghi]
MEQFNLQVPSTWRYGAVLEGHQSLTPQYCFCFSHQLVSANSHKNVAHFNNGSHIVYKKIKILVPLEVLCGLIYQKKVNQSLKTIANGLALLLILLAVEFVESQG